MKKSKLRAFNNEGMEKFKNQLHSEIESKETSKKWRRNESEWEFIFDEKYAPQFDQNIELEQRDFVSRFEMGKYLTNKITTDYFKIYKNGFLLNWISAFYFEKISGAKKALESYFYVDEYSSYYRHFIRSCWYLVYKYGDDSEWLLSGKTNVFPDITEQVSSKQYVMQHEEIVRAAQRLYCVTDENGILTNKHKNGISAKSPGDIRRFTAVWLRQIQKNYFINDLSSNKIFSLLPANDEFDRWMEKQ